MEHTPSSGWSFLRDSSRLRGIIKYKIENSDKKLVDIAAEVGIRVDSMSKYLRAVKPSLTDYAVLKLADHLGIEVTLEVRLKP